MYLSKYVFCDGTMGKSNIEKDTKLVSDESCVLFSKEYLNYLSQHFESSFVISVIVNKLVNLQRELQLAVTKESSWIYLKNDKLIQKLFSY